MYKVLLISFICLFALSAVRAQGKKAVVTSTIQTPTVQCESCKKRIEDQLKRVDGIQKVVVDVKKKTAKVTYLTDRTNLENIKTDIANLGYDADDVAANPEAYSRLPKCCQKPEDGGGMKKE